MARWIQEVPLSDPDGRYTLIAGWWPTTFYRVMTLQVKIASATEGISVLTRELCEMFPERCGSSRDYFVTAVYKTNRYGNPQTKHWIREFEYPDKTRAMQGHDRIVAALAQGRRFLSRLPASL